MIAYIMMVVVLHSPTELTPVSKQVPSCEVANKVASILERDKQRGEILEYAVMCAPLNLGKFQETSNDR